MITQAQPSKPTPAERTPSLPSTDPLELLKIASIVATEAGALAAKMRHEGISVATTKSNQLDIVTQADTAVEELIRHRLAAARPNDGILGEEGGEEHGDSDIIWIVDPIDGTVNYLYGSPYYAVSIAATVRDDVGPWRSVAACVFAPALGAKYTAAEGGPAQLNGSELHVNRHIPLERALVSTGIPYDLTKRERVLRDINKLTPRIRDFRLVGAAALEICGVAEGRTDGHFQRGLPIWDWAAATLIAKQAGAEIRITGSDPGIADLLIVADPKLVDLLEPHLA